VTGTVLSRARQRSRRHAGARDDEEATPGDDDGPAGRTRWFSRPVTRATVVTSLALGALVTVTPASSAAGDIANSFVRTVQYLESTSRNGQAFDGTAAVGALFATSAGKLSQHFCTASVIHSPHGDLVITAAHCVTGTSGTVVFVPAYTKGVAPYGAWTVTKVYVDHAWSSSANPADDVAILKVRKPGSTAPIEDETGAEELATSAVTTHQIVQVIGYPDSTNQPITCRNWLKEPVTDQLEFDCGGYTDGTSGGPFLAKVDFTTGQGTVIGVIGGYEQGGDTPQVSYSSAFGSNVAALYRTAVAGG
jgi:V8-like Glu-specific endopeptidase